MPLSDPPGAPKEWLARARGKLALARGPLPPEGFWEDLCYMAQQAAELAIKAVYQQRGWRFPFVHDLGELLDGLQKRGLKIPEAVQNADQLTVYATQARYPGVAAVVTQADHLEALDVAESVLVWAEEIVR